MIKTKDCYVKGYQLNNKKDAERLRKQLKQLETLKKQNHKAMIELKKAQNTNNKQIALR